MTSQDLPVRRPLEVFMNRDEAYRGGSITKSVKTKKPSKKLERMIHWFVELAAGHPVPKRAKKKA